MEILSSKIKPSAMVFVARIVVVCLFTNFFVTAGDSQAQKKIVPKPNEILLFGEESGNQDELFQKVITDLSDDTLAIGIHGEPNGIVYLNGEAVPAEKILPLIKEHLTKNPQIKKILLGSCSGGLGMDGPSIAQVIAEATDKPVTAPLGVFNTENMRVDPNNRFDATFLGPNDKIKLVRPDYIDAASDLYTRQRMLGPVYKRYQHYDGTISWTEVHPDGTHDLLTARQVINDNSLKPGSYHPDISDYKQIGAIEKGGCGCIGGRPSLSSRLLNTGKSALPGLILGGGSSVAEGWYQGDTPEELKDRVVQDAITGAAVSTGIELLAPEIAPIAAPAGIIGGILLWTSRGYQGLFYYGDGSLRVSPANIPAGTYAGSDADFFQ